MSKTFRRKNYEDTQGTSWDRQGRKTAGFYTAYDFNDFSRWWNRGDVTYRPMTKAEYRKEYKRAHGESSNGNARTPGKVYKQDRMGQNRSINNCELTKWKKYPDDYEPLWEDEPRSHWWDWS